MAESIIISLGGGLRHLGHFGHFDCLPHFNFFNRSGGVSGLGDGSSDGSLMASPTMMAASSVDLKGGSSTTV